MKPAAALASIAVAAALSVLIVGHAAEERPTDCISDEAARERMRSIILDGIDAGMKAHTQRMFEIWLKDNTAQPSRAIHGMQDGIRAYIRSRAAALRWDLAICKEKQQ